MDDMRWPVFEFSFWFSHQVVFKTQNEERVARPRIRGTSYVD